MRRKPTRLPSCPRSPITSPIAIFETALGICRKQHAGVERSEQDVGELLELAGVRTAPITDQETHAALAACFRCGHGRGHPVQLNLSDCFAYAMAKNARTELLFKGKDFDRTDIRPAARPR